MSIDFSTVYELQTQIVAIERSAANSEITPDCQSYIDLLKRSRQTIDALTLELRRTLRHVHAWERAGVAGAVSPPESSGVQQ